MQMSKLTITSPFDGVNCRPSLFTPGTKVASGTLALKVMDYSKLKLNVEFPEKYIPLFSTGKKHM
jgi:hypothetical protein